MPTIVRSEAPLRARDRRVQIRAAQGLHGRFPVALRGARQLPTLLEVLGEPQCVRLALPDQPLACEPVEVAALRPGARKPHALVHVQICRRALARRMPGLPEHPLDDCARALAILGDPGCAVAQVGQVRFELRERAGVDPLLLRAYALGQVLDQPRGNLGEVIHEAQRITDLVGEPRDHTAEGCELRVQCELHALHRLVLEAAVQQRVLHCDGRLAGEHNEQIQIWLGEDMRRVKGVDVEQPDDVVLELEGTHIDARIDRATTERAASRCGSSATSTKSAATPLLRST